jgi:hypothetical protein
MKIKTNILKSVALLVLVPVVCSALLCGCSNANKAAMSAWGKKHRVTLYSGGKQIGQWTTSGKIENEHRSDGYYFRDNLSGKIVMVNGDVIIEVVEGECFLTTP